MKISSPLTSIFIAFMYILLISSIFGIDGFYKDNSFFRWGTPITFFSKQITDQKVFYSLLLLMFFHQLVNNYVNTIVYPWILNSVQDHKCLKVEYVKTTSLLIINLFDIYSELDVVLILAGFSSQVSFVLVIILANLITSTYFNYLHLEKKESQPLLPF